MMTLGLCVAMAAPRIAILSWSRVQVYISTDDPLSSICLMMLSGVLLPSIPFLLPRAARAPHARRLSGTRTTHTHTLARTHTREEQRGGSA